MRKKNDEQDDDIRVFRGGSWNLIPVYALAECHVWRVSRHRFDNLGMRFVRHRSVLERLVVECEEETQTSSGGES